MTRPEPNFMVIRAGHSWTLRLFTEQPDGLVCASAAGIEKRSVRGIRTVGELRGILQVLTGAYPKLTRVAIDNSWGAIEDILSMTETA